MVNEQIERCYGIIPLRLYQEGVQAFLIQHLKGEHWGFPKGHPEDGESFQQTAERELFEETGLQVEHYLPYPSFIEKYQFQSKEGHLIFKEVTLYLAQVSSHFQLNVEEVIQGKWFFLEKLLNTVTFPSQKELYKKLIDLFS